jgi:hypothetical protein
MKQLELVVPMCGIWRFGVKKKTCPAKKNFDKLSVNGYFVSV